MLVKVAIGGNMLCCAAGGAGAGAGGVESTPSIGSAILNVSVVYPDSEQQQQKKELPLLSC